MKNTQYSDIRLTDELERRLLREAISAQHSYSLDIPLKDIILKVIRFFKAPEVEVLHGPVRSAH